MKKPLIVNKNQDHDIKNNPVFTTKIMFRSEFRGAVSSIFILPMFYKIS